MNKHEEAKNQDAGKRPLPASYGPLVGQPASHDAAAVYTDPRQVVGDPTLHLGAKPPLAAVKALRGR